MVVNDPSSTFQLNSGRRGEEGVAATLSVGRRGKYARQQHCSTAPGGGCRPSSPLPGRGASNSFTVMNVSPMPPRECLSPPLVSGSRVNTSRSTPHRLLERLSWQAREWACSRWRLPRLRASARITTTGGKVSCNVPSNQREGSCSAKTPRQLQGSWRRPRRGTGYGRRPQRGASTLRTSTAEPHFVPMPLLLPPWAALRLLRCGSPGRRW